MTLGDVWHSLCTQRVCFHIIRSVEIGVKAYVHAAIGTLPPMTKRNLGEYISQLKTANAPINLIDLVAILKTKRNPLMHPQERLDEPQAIDIFCICQAVTATLIDAVKSKQLDAAFGASLALLPTL
jgi:hypothetical protein